MTDRDITARTVSDLVYYTDTSTGSAFTLSDALHMAAKGKRFSKERTYELYDLPAQAEPLERVGSGVINEHVTSALKTVHPDQYIQVPALERGSQAVKRAYGSFVADNLGALMTKSDASNPLRIIDTVLAPWSATSMRHPRYIPRYRNQHYDEKIFKHLAVMEQQMPGIRSHLLEAKELMLRFARDYVLSTGTLQGQLGRLQEINRVREMTQPDNNFIQALSFKEFMRESERLLPLIGAKGLRLSDEFIASVRAAEDAGHTVVTINRTADTGVSFSRGENSVKNGQVIFQNFALADNMIKLLKAGRFSKKHWKFVLLARVKPKFEAFKRERENSMARNICVYSAFAMMPMQFIVNNSGRYLSFQDDPSSPILQGWTPLNGQLQRMINHCFERKERGLASHFIYADNLYYFGPVVGPEGPTWAWVSMDGSKMESSHTATEALYFAQRRLHGTNSDPVYQEYAKIWATMATKSIGLLGSTQFPLPFLGSGAVGTFELNTQKMAFLADRGFKALGGRPIVVWSGDSFEFDPAFYEESLRAGVLMTIEQVTPAAALESAAPGSFVEMDLLGFDAYNIGRDVPYWVGVLNRERLAKAMVFNRLLNEDVSSPLSVGWEVRLSRLISLYLIGGWARVAEGAVLQQQILALVTESRRLRRSNVDPTAVGGFLETIGVEADVGPHLTRLGVPYLSRALVIAAGQDRGLPVAAQYLKDLSGKTPVNDFVSEQDAELFAKHGYEAPRPPPGPKLTLKTRAINLARGTVADVFELPLDTRGHGGIEAPRGTRIKPTENPLASLYPGLPFDDLSPREKQAVLSRASAVLDAWVRAGGDGSLHVPSKAHKKAERLTTLHGGEPKRVALARMLSAASKTPMGALLVALRHYGDHDLVVSKAPPPGTSSRFAGLMSNIGEAAKKYTDRWEHKTRVTRSTGQRAQKSGSTRGPPRRGAIRQLTEEDFGEQAWADADYDYDQYVDDFEEFAADLKHSWGYYDDYLDEVEEEFDARHRRRRRSDYDDYEEYDDYEIEEEDYVDEDDPMYDVYMGQAVPEEW